MTNKIIRQIQLEIDDQEKMVESFNARAKAGRICLQGLRAELAKEIEKARYTINDEDIVPGAVFRYCSEGDLLVVIGVTRPLILDSWLEEGEDLFALGGFRDDPFQLWRPSGWKNGAATRAVVAQYLRDLSARKEGEHIKFEIIKE